MFCEPVEFTNLLPLVTHPRLVVLTTTPAKYQPYPAVVTRKHKMTVKLDSDSQQAKVVALRESLAADVAEKLQANGGGILDDVMLRRQGRLSANPEFRS